MYEQRGPSKYNCYCKNRNYRIRRKYAIKLIDIGFYNH